MTGEENDQVNEEQQGNGPEGDAPEAKARRVLTDISPRTWEHPADRAALAALRKLPVFDEVLKKIFGFFGEKPVRLAFQANAVKVKEKKYPHKDELHQ